MTNDDNLRVQFPEDHPIVGGREGEPDVPETGRTQIPPPNIKLARIRLECVKPPVDDITAAGVRLVQLEQGPVWLRVQDGRRWLVATEVGRWLI